VHIDDEWVYAHRPLLEKEGMKQGEFASGLIFPGAQILTVGDEQRLYFEARDGKIKHEQRFEDNVGQIGMASWKRDRLVSLRPAHTDATGAITTKPFALKGGALQLNVKALDSSCSPSVKVEVLRSGTPFHGRTITEAVPITGVDGWVDVYWRQPGTTGPMQQLGRANGFGVPLGSMIQLRIFLTGDAELFAFQMVEMEIPPAAPSPPPSPSPSPPPPCPATCGANHHTCDEMIAGGTTTCAELESVNQCDCTGCSCVGPTVAPSVASTAAPATATLAASAEAPSAAPLAAASAAALSAAPLAVASAAAPSAAPVSASTAPTSSPPEEQPAPTQAPTATAPVFPQPLFSGVNAAAGSSPATEAPKAEEVASTLLPSSMTSVMSSPALTFLLILLLAAVVSSLTYMAKQQRGRSLMDDVDGDGIQPEGSHSVEMGPMEAEMEAGQVLDSLEDGGEIVPGPEGLGDAKAQSPPESKKSKSAKLKKSRKKIKEYDGDCDESSVLHSSEY